MKRRLVRVTLVCASKWLWKLNEKGLESFVELLDHGIVPFNTNCNMWMESFIANKIKSRSSYVYSLDHHG